MTSRPSDPLGLHLVDSSIWIPAYRRRPAPRIEARLRELLDLNAAAVNEQIELEILIAHGDRREFERIRDQIRGIRRLPVVSRTWELAGELGFLLRRQGIVVATPDLLIAASATEHGAVLVHADADFDRIAGATDLKVESYVDAVS